MIQKTTWYSISYCKATFINLQLYAWLDFKLSIVNLLPKCKERVKQKYQDSVWHGHHSMHIIRGRLFFWLLIRVAVVVGLRIVHQKKPVWYPHALTEMVYYFCSISQNRFILNCLLLVDDIRWSNRLSNLHAKAKGQSVREDDLNKRTEKIPICLT